MEMVWTAMGLRFNGTVERIQNVDHGRRDSMPMYCAVSPIPAGEICSDRCLHDGDGHPSCLLELAGIEKPGRQFQGREIVPMRGSSWVGHLASRDLPGTSVHDENEYITGWELFGLRAIRQGPWKAVWMPEPRGKDRWELYDMKMDPGEIHDLADVEVEILERLIKHWERYYTETGMFDYGHNFPYVMQ